MELTVQSLALAALVLVPGLVGFYANRALATSPGEGPGDLELVLISLAASVVLVAVEAGLAAFLAIFWEDLRHGLGSLVEAGPRNYAAQFPVRVLGGGSVVVLANVILMAAAGYFNPIGVFLRQRLSSRNLSEGSVWYEVFGATGAGAGTEATRKPVYKAVRVWLRSGGYYTGYLSMYSLRRDKGGGREIVLQDASFSPSGEAADRKKIPDVGWGNAVIIGSADIRSIEVVYDRRSRSSRGSLGSPSP